VFGNPSFRRGNTEQLFIERQSVRNLPGSASQGTASVQSPVARSMAPSFMASQGLAYRGNAASMAGSGGYAHPAQASGSRGIAPQVEADSMTEVPTPDSSG